MLSAPDRYALPHDGDQWWLRNKVIPRVRTPRAIGRFNHVGVVREERAWGGFRRRNLTDHATIGHPADTSRRYAEEHQAPSSQTCDGDYRSTRASERSGKVQAEKQIACKPLYSVASATRLFVRVSDVDTTRTKRYKLQQGQRTPRCHVDDPFKRRIFTVLQSLYLLHLERRRVF